MRPRAPCRGEHQLVTRARWRVEMGREGGLTRALEVLGVSVDEGVGGDVANVDHFDLEKGGEP